MNNKEVFVFIIIILVGAIAGHFWAHEQAHIRIFSYYGTKSYLTFDAAAFALKIVPEGWVNNEATLPNSINEAIGYQLAPLFIGVMGFQIITIMVLMRRRK